MFSIHPRIRIGIVLLSSFLISGYLMKYTQQSPQAFAPTIQIQGIAADFSKQLTDSKDTLISSIQSIRIPQLISLTPSSNNEPTVAPEPTAGAGEWERLPTSTPAQPFPTSPLPSLYPSSYPSSYPSAYPSIKVSPTTPPINPTNPPKPTTKPKPTAIPELPPITSDTRPGSSIEEILREVSKRACVPYALLMATRTMESGVWFKNASMIKTWNTYGWWKGADKSTVCAGLAYYTQSGLIPADSGGGSCTNGVQPGAYDQKIMGLMQMSEQEEQVTRPTTKKTLPGNIDRRVIFDNALIYAVATKGRAGNSPQPSCDDWPQETVKLVAQKHYGACKYSGGDYCAEIWNLYKSFK
jgi:hypothetical protein